MSPALVIFDCDGVLVDSEETSNRALGEAITAAGWPISYEETRAAFIGGTIGGVKDTVEEWLGRPLPESWGADFDRSREEMFRREGVPAIPGVEAVISLLRARDLPYCVASSGRPEKMAITLPLAGLDGYFEGRIFSASMVPRPKPYPDLFLYAAASFDVAPRAAVVIEDTVVGVTAAVAAGIPVFGFAADSDPAALAAAGATVFDSMADLPALLGIQ